MKATITSVTPDSIIVRTDAGYIGECEGECLQEKEFPEMKGTDICSDGCVYAKSVPEATYTIPRDEEVERLAIEQVKKEGWGEFDGTSEQNGIKNSFIAGYNAHKGRFTLEQMIDAAMWFKSSGWEYHSSGNYTRSKNKITGEFDYHKWPPDECCERKDVLNEYLASLTPKVGDLIDIEVIDEQNKIARIIEP